VNLRDSYGGRIFTDPGDCFDKVFDSNYVEWLEKKLEEERFSKNIVKLKVNDLYMYLKGGKE